MAIELNKLMQQLQKLTPTKGVPTIIISRTIKGKSLEHMEDNPQWHGKAPDSDIVPIINSGIRFSIFDCSFYYCR